MQGLAARPPVIGSVFARRRERDRERRDSVHAWTTLCVERGACARVAVLQRPFLRTKWPNPRSVIER